MYDADDRLVITVPAGGTCENAGAESAKRAARTSADRSTPLPVEPVEKSVIEFLLFTAPPRRLTFLYVSYFITLFDYYSCCVSAFHFLSFSPFTDSEAAPPWGPASEYVI